MSVFAGKWTFMIKTLVMAREYRNTTYFPKIPLWRLYIGLQSQKCFFDLFFDREWQYKKFYLHYKPCLLMSLSSRKNWDIFALSIEKIDFFIFSYFNLKAHLSALITPEGQIRPRSCKFFWIPHSRIDIQLALFWFRPYFEKFLRVPSYGHFWIRKCIKMDSFFEIYKKN